MSAETIPEIPSQIRDVMYDDEIENMRNLDGWAVGTVGLYQYGQTTETIEDAWIELFNGDGRAGEFGGVRFMAVTDGEYEEAYAYGDSLSLEQNTDNAWYVKEYEHIDGDVGTRAP